MMRELLRFALQGFSGKNERRLRASGGVSLFSEEFFVRAFYRSRIRVTRVTRNHRDHS